MPRFIQILRTRKTQLALALVLALGTSVVPVHGAQAGIGSWIGTSIETIASGAILSIVGPFLYLIVTILGWILYGLGNLLNFLIQPQPITSATIVVEGFKITRDFANMFFILILLGIAVDFILFNSFKVKRMLPRLILIALLINFSLPLAGILIDFANVFTSFFLDQVTNHLGFTEVVMNDLHITKLFSGNDFTTGLGNAIDAFNGLTLNLVFATIYIAGTIVVFAAMCLMFIVRTGYLYFLLIILPIVLVLSAFPPTGSHWNRWTSSFIKWTMFAPIATFFLYLSLLFFDLTAKLTLGGATSNGGSIDFVQTMYSFVMIWVFMLGSLIAAQSMGVHAGGFAMKAFSTTGKWARGKLAQGGRWAWRETGGRAADTAAHAIGAQADRAAASGGRLGALGAMVGGFGARQIQRVGVAARTGYEEKRDAETRARYKNYSSEELEREIRTLHRSGMNNGVLATLATMQMEKGEETGLTTAQLRTIYDSRAVSAQQRMRLRRGSPALALQVLPVPAGPVPAIGTPARATYDQAIRERRDYINGLRQSDIEKIPRADLAQPGVGGVGTVMRDLIGEMITGGNWSDNKFKALNDIDPALFLAEFDTYLGAIPKATRGPAVPPATRGPITGAPAGHGIGTDQNYLKLARYLESTAGQGLTTVAL